MILTVTDTATGPLPPGAVPIMESLAQHRLLTTLQIHELHTPTKTTHWARHVLRRLHAAELVDAARLPGGLGLWFLTEQGTEAIELIPSRPERRRKQITHAQATGPLRHHTLAVNDVGLAFVRAARARGDECGPLAWRHEIAHPIGPAPGRRTPVSQAGFDGDLESRTACPGRGSVDAPSTQVPARAVGSWRSGRARERSADRACGT